MEILLIEDNPEDVEITIAGSFRSIIWRTRFMWCGTARRHWNASSAQGDTPIGPFCSHIRLILLDIKLPKVDGLEVLQRCKSDPRTKNIPVVVLTSSREDHDLVESYNLGVNSYVVKPVDFSQFTEAVRQLGLYWMVLNERPSEQSSEGKD